jgi:cell division septal protein FtsQ
LALRERLLRLPAGDEGRQPIHFLIIGTGRRRLLRPRLEMLLRRLLLLLIMLLLLLLLLMLLFQSLCWSRWLGTMYE